MNPVSQNPCTNEQDFYTDVYNCVGEPSLPGVRAYVYVTRKRNITKWPALKSEAAKLEDLVTYEGDFTLDADKKWAIIELADDENDFNVKSNGKSGGKTFINTVNIVVPGTEEKASGLATAMNNDNLVFLVPQRNGKFRVIGNKMFKVNVDVDMNSGKKTEDGNSTALTLTVEDISAAPFYPGKIETNNGDISGATGEPIVLAP